MDESEAPDPLFAPREPDLAPAPTSYRGVAFRSRLEGRWAVFLDALGVAWRYEPRAFALPSGSYLPDFELLGLGAWLEIKPTAPVPREVALCDELATAVDGPVFLFAGRPPGLGIAFARGRREPGWRWTKCLRCARVVVSGPERGACRCGGVAGPHADVALAALVSDRFAFRDGGAR